MTAKIDTASIQADHHALLSNTEMLRHLMEDRRFNIEEIKRRLLGWVEQGGFSWFSFPVFDAHGECKYKKLKKPPTAPDAQPKGKFHPEGSVTMLYPLNDFKKGDDMIVLCEGEPDTIAARSLGLPAFCGTAGAQTFRVEWIEELREGNERKKVFVLFDNDEAGKKGTEIVIALLSKYCPSWEIFSIAWSEGFMDKGDVTDFLRNYKGDDPKTALLSLTRHYAPPSPQEQIKVSLRKGSYKVIMPLQAVNDGVGYYAVSLAPEGQSKLFVVTSSRECFLCTDEEFQKRNMRVVRMPLHDSSSRWEQQQLSDFLDGAETMSLGDALHYVVDQLHKYLDLPDPRFYQSLGLWIVATYFHRLFQAFPYFHIIGIYKSGKSKVVQVATLLAFNGEMFTDPTAATIIRLVHHNGLTLGIDEADRLERSRDEDTATLQEILRSGYKQGMSVPRCERDGTNGHQMVVRYDPYSPKIIAGTKPLEPALASRAIQMVMLRSQNANVANREINSEGNEWSDVRSILYPAALCAMPQVQEGIDAFDCKEVLGRDAEVWRPLLVVAKIADPTGTLYAEVLTFAKEIQERSRQEEEDDSTLKVLPCIYEMFGEDDERFIPVQDIWSKLAEYDESFAWVIEEKSKGKRQRWINATLKRLGLWEGRAKSERSNGETMKGYRITRKKVEGIAMRYGVTLDPPTPAESVTSVTDVPDVPL